MFKLCKKCLTFFTLTLINTILFSQNFNREPRHGVSVMAMLLDSKYMTRKNWRRKNQLGLNFMSKGGHNSGKRNGSSGTKGDICIQL